MANGAVLANLGLYVEPGFLDDELRQRLRSEIEESQKTDVPPDVRGRKVSAVVFVKGESSDEAEADSFGGGELIFYGLMGDDERTKSVGFPLDGTAGELVAFPSDMWHEVNAVTRGERHTIVCWFK